MPLEIAGIGLTAALAAGVVSFVSPCVLPLVPGYVSYIAGRSLDDIAYETAWCARLATVGLSFSFVLGFSSVFVALGASATAVGQLLQAFRYEASYAAGALIIVFGLHMMGVLRFGLLNRDFRFVGTVRGGRPAGAFVLGTAFAFGWTPCIGPILGAILTLGAATSNAADGAVLLLVYSTGLAVPFLLVAVFTGPFMKRVSSVRWLGRWLQPAAGGMLVIIGVGIVTGYLNAAGTWMLQTFPAFQLITL